MKFLRRVWLAACCLVGPWLAQAEAPPVLSIERWCGPARLSLQGPAGFTYVIEGSDTFGLAEGWQPLATFNVMGDGPSWKDAQSERAPRRFYRAIQYPLAPPEEAPDFRLLDQLGRSHWLHYYQGAPRERAVVLVFSAAGCAPFRDRVETLKSLTNTFGPQGVLFWLLDSASGVSRSNLLVAATAIGFSNSPPILQDSAQLVARSYRAATAGEVVAINTADMTVFYRGAIDDRQGGEAVASTQHHLADALTAFLGNGDYSLTRTRPSGCPLDLPPPVTATSYAADIVPVLQARCVRCHSPGNLAPWAMTNYDVVRVFAPAIRASVLTGQMPPWHADNVQQHYANDFSLRPDEARRLVQWIDEGCPRGTGPDPLAEGPTAPSTYPFAWPAEMGAPTVVVRIPRQNVPAIGTVQYRYIEVTNPLTNDVWLQAAVVRPGNTRVVHHCLVFEGDSSSSLGGLAGYFAGYVPGSDPAPFPDGTGKLLKRGQRLTFQMHYTTIGTAETDQTELGFYVAPAAPARSLLTRAAFNAGFTVPASNSAYQATASFPPLGTLATNILLYEFSPHMHLRGSAFKYEIQHANGTREPLVSVPFFLFHWQTLYRLAQPKYVPRGSRIVCTAVWDNSGQNRELMSAFLSSGHVGYLPSRGVRFGEQSWEEMCIGYMNYAEVP